MDSGLFRSPISRIIVGGVSLFSLILFIGIWVATLITTGFSLAGTQTFAGWTYFPLFWPHLAAATLSAMIFLRYGANYASALTAVVLWIVAVVCDVFGAVVYWRLFWLCNIGGKGQLTGVALQICNSEDALLISMMVFATVMMIVAAAGAIAQGFDLFQAGRSGSVSPGRELSAELILVGAASIVSFLCLIGLWITNFITTAISVGGGHTYAVWAHTNILLVQISASVLGIMLFLRYGANYITAAAAVILWAIAFFAAFYCNAVYWRIGWMCFGTTGNTLTGNALVICNEEDTYLIAVWVIVSILGICAIIGPLAHGADYFSAARTGSIEIGLGSRGKDSSVDMEGVVPSDMDPPESDLEGNPGNMDQLAPFNDGSMFAAARAGTKSLKHAGSRLLSSKSGPGQPSPSRHTHRNYGPRTPLSPQSTPARVDPKIVKSHRTLAHLS